MRISLAKKVVWVLCVLLDIRFPYSNAPWLLFQELIERTMIGTRRQRLVMLAMAAHQYPWLIKLLFGRDCADRVKEVMSFSKDAFTLDPTVRYARYVLLTVIADTTIARYGNDEVLRILDIVIAEVELLKIHTLKGQPGYAKMEERWNSVMFYHNTILNQRQLGATQ